MRSLLFALFREVFSQAFAQLPPQSRERALSITPTAPGRSGHYQCNSAMKLAKELGRPSREIGVILANFLQKSSQAALFSHIEVGGPGFVTLTFSPHFLSQSLLQKIFQEKHLGVSLSEKRGKVVIDFSSPNVAKQLHVGHLRSTLLGDCLVRLFSWLEYEVLPLNHLGDWGTSFGMLICYLEQHHPDLLEQETEHTLSQLEEWYREAKERFDTEEAFRQASRQVVVRLQEEEPRAMRYWEVIRTISRKGYEEIYHLLDVAPLERGESFYRHLLARVIEELEERGLITLSEGAKCVYLEGFQSREGEPLPLIVEKRDGGYNYATTDLAAMRHRTQEERATRILIVTDLGQSLHFQMISQVAQKLGYLDPAHHRFDHVTFGLVRNARGKKYRTRSGDTEKLMDLLQLAISRARALLQERFADSPLSDEQLQQRALILGINAVKYADLSTDRMQDYLFDEKKMLSFEGNTAPFLLYAYVRLRSIEKKLKGSISFLEGEWGDFLLTHPRELSLAYHLLRFAEVIEELLDKLSPHRLSDYLYQLAGEFHLFFQECRVVGDVRERERALLCKAVQKVLGRGLQLLGLKLLDQM